MATASQAQTADSVSLLFSGSLLSPTFRALKFLFYFFLHLSLCSLLLICQNLTILSQSCGGSNGHSLKVASEKLDFPQATGKVLGRKPVPRLSARRSRSREGDRHSAHPDAPGRPSQRPPRRPGETRSGSSAPYLAGGTSMLEETTLRFCSSRQTERVFSLSWSAVFPSSSMAEEHEC